MLLLMGNTESMVISGDNFLELAGGFSSSMNFVESLTLLDPTDKSLEVLLVPTYLASNNMIDYFSAPSVGYSFGIDDIENEFSVELENRGVADKEIVYDFLPFYFNNKLRHCSFYYPEVAVDEIERTCSAHKIVLQKISNLDRAVVFSRKTKGKHILVYTFDKCINVVFSEGPAILSVLRLATYFTDMEDVLGEIIPLHISNNDGLSGFEDVDADVIFANRFTFDVITGSQHEGGGLGKLYSVQKFNVPEGVF